MRPIFVIALILVFNILDAQTYKDIPVKEEYDFYNAHEVNVDHRPCTLKPDKDERTFGDGMSKILEGYITMYKTTGDKAYLYKFVLQSLCVMENRHDLNESIASNIPRWATEMYHDSYIIAAFSRFVYFIKLEEPALLNEPIYQFDELNPSNYLPNTCNCNSFGITFLTFGQYANWLQDRVIETLNWFLDHGYWHNTYGMLQHPYSNNTTGVCINMQIGFGRALFFIGLTTGENYFLDKANTIANLFKGKVVFKDRCENKSYNDYVLRLTEDNAYWWYHYGWSVTYRDCWDWWYYLKEPKYSQFVEYVEDISHGAVVTWLPLDFYHFQPNSPFTIDDMIRFRNMFTKYIYDGEGGFYNNVDSSDNPVSIRKNQTTNYAHNHFHPRALNYILFADFDGADATATPPNVYDIVFTYYKNHIQGYTSTPFGEYLGQDNKGHAEVVQAQWKRECPNLTLYNRKVVYNQDFKAKGALTIAPKETLGKSYAEPIIQDKIFTVEPGTTVNMVSGKSVVLKHGTHIKSGSNFRAYIDPALCSNTQNNSNPNRSNNKEEQRSIPNKENDTIVIGGSFENSLDIYPNPFASETLIQITLQKPSNVTLTVLDSFGRTVFNQFVDMQLEEGVYNIPFSGEDLTAGFYHCILTIDNQTRLTEKMIKQ